MSRFDWRGSAISGATPAALEAYEAGVAASHSWRTGAREHVARALDASPAFVMAHVLDAWLSVATRDPVRVHEARPALERALRLPANARERLHLDAIGAVLRDDYAGARARLARVLDEHPRDVVALQVAHSFDYLCGDVARLRDRVARVLPAWSAAVPGHASVLAMHGFGLEEGGDYAQAAALADRALALDPGNARAHHVHAHVFEMTGRPADGVSWLTRQEPYWAIDTVFATHGWWHVALFELARGNAVRALWLYDTRVRAARSQEVSDLIDAAALLWRVELAGVDASGRWRELAAAWEPHIDDAFCTFNDVHAMMAFVGARAWPLAERLTRTLERRSVEPTRHAETTRRVGWRASQALIAFGRRNYARAAGLLARLRSHAHRIGGSRAQRGVLRITLAQALKRLVSGNRASAWAARRAAA